MAKAGPKSLARRYNLDMAASAAPRFTHDEFLDREQHSPFRHEYTRGHVEMMSGGTENHSLLATSLTYLLTARLLDRDCSVHGSDLLVRINIADMSTYPDAMVICGKAHFPERRKLVVDNPVLLVEVLSPSTVTFDRGAKLAAYKQLASLREILFIAQDQPSVEYMQKGPDGWISTILEGREAILSLVHLQVSIPLADLYRRVTWEADVTEDLR